MYKRVRHVLRFCVSYLSFVMKYEHMLRNGLRISCKNFILVIGYRYIHLYLCMYLLFLRFFDFCHQLEGFYIMIRNDISIFMGVKVVNIILEERDLKVFFKSLETLKIGCTRM